MFCVNTKNLLLPGIEGHETSLSELCDSERATIYVPNMNGA